MLYLLMDHWLTKEHIIEAQMFSEFTHMQNKVDCPDLTPRMWCLSQVGQCYDNEVDAALAKEDLHPYLIEPERDDDEAPRGIDDIDAALQYLSEGGSLVKIPDRIGVDYFHLYVIDPIPEMYRFISEHFAPERSLCPQEKAPASPAPVATPPAQVVTPSATRDTFGAQNLKERAKKLLNEQLRADAKNGLLLPRKR